MAIVRGFGRYLEGFYVRRGVGVDCGWTDLHNVVSSGTTKLKAPHLFPPLPINLGLADRFFWFAQPAKWKEPRVKGKKKKT